MDLSSDTFTAFITFSNAAFFLLCVTPTHLNSSLVGFQLINKKASQISVEEKSATVFSHYHYSGVFKGMSHYHIWLNEGVSECK